MKNNTTNINYNTTNINFKPSLYRLSNEGLKSKLTDRVVIYHNEGASSIKKDGIRTLVIKRIDKVGFSKNRGYRYIQGLVQDIDDSGEVKSRTLHVAGIQKVKGRLSTAITLAKSVY